MSKNNEKEQVYQCINPMCDRVFNEPQPPLTFKLLKANKIVGDYTMDGYNIHCRTCGLKYSSRSGTSEPSNYVNSCWSTDPELTKRRGRHRSKVSESN